MAIMFSPCDLKEGGEACVVHLDGPPLYGETGCWLDALYLVDDERVPLLEP